MPEFVLGGQVWEVNWPVSVPKKLRRQINAAVAKEKKDRVEMPHSNAGRLRNSQASRSFPCVIGRFSS